MYHHIRTSIQSIPITQQNIDKFRALNGPCGTVEQQWNKHEDKTKPMMAFVWLGCGRPSDPNTENFRIQI